MKKFTVTNDHLKLLKRFGVGWQDCEFGAPEIDPKRPYGNSDVLTDIWEILGKPPKHEDDEFTDAETNMMNTLHKQTEVVLQIVLSTQKFETGDYEADDYPDVWKKL